MQGHGVHGMELRWFLRGPAGAIQFVFSTDWIPGELWPGHGVSPDGSRGWIRLVDGLWSTDPSGRGIGIHSLVPQYDGHAREPGCALLDAPCYYDEQLSGADRFVPRFLADGDQPIWDELAARYAELLERSS